jgi:L-ascorbate oxidase
MSARSTMRVITVVVRSFLQRRPSCALLRFGLALLLLSSALGVAKAQTDERVLSNPPPLQIQQGTQPTTTLLAAPAPPAMVNKKTLDLNIQYTNSAIYNPATGRNDKVKLRSYVGTNVDPKAPYVAPTIEVDPGDTVRITLHNKLPPDPSCFEMDENPDIPHCFNGTNLHSHGLWISPTGNSDNVLLSINPGVDFQYEYNIPSDHPAGSFWYHPHRHGSTALQVASGMAGALIVRGSRLPTLTSHGDIDTLLKNRDGSAMAEKVLVLQQIQYACLDADGNIKVKKNDKGEVIAWICDPGDTGVIEFYSDKNNNGFGPSSWNQSGRYTSINGLVLPTFEATAGVIERWRLIHAGVRDTISLQLFKMKPQAPAFNQLLAADEDSYIGDNCTGDPLPYQIIASDGLTMAAAQQTTLATLQPGYRNDALVVFPDAGKYCVVNAAVSAASSVTRDAVPRRLLGVVNVKPGTQVPNIRNYIVDNLVASAQRRTFSVPPAVRANIIADLKNGLKLTNFTPHPDITDDEVKGRTQYLTFFISIAPNKPPKFEVGTAPFGQPFNTKPYDPNVIDRHLILGNADEWQLQSRFVSHPFHIHVNPFQIVKIIDPNGKDVSAEGAVDDSDPNAKTADPQYPGLKDVWKDTLWIKSWNPTASENPDPNAKGIYTIVIRTRYERYIGEFVLHCHILDHEDQGMMENVKIDIPDGKGGAAHEH